MKKYILQILGRITPIQCWRKKMRARAVEIENEELIKKYWKNDVRILYGPFKGMRYITQSSGSVLFPKLIGCYEENLHPWMDEIRDKKYDLIIDIGCAEGYYAAGFVYANYAPIVYAYDIDERAQKNAADLIALNELTDRVVIGGLCTGETIAELTKSKKALIFCDIEGAEDILLDPQMTPSLRKVDLIVEMHDMFKKGVTNRLIERFEATHRIAVASELETNYEAYPFLLSLGKKKRKCLTRENRARGMVWLKLTVR